MGLTNGRAALAQHKQNPTAKWNRTGKSDARSDVPEDASNRIFDGYADIRPRLTGPRAPASAAVFAMGSCFAREIEYELSLRGGLVISQDDRLHSPAFAHERDLPSSFLHRYTPTSMLQEFQAAFGECAAWSDDALIVVDEGAVHDLNYPDIKAPATAEAVFERRRVALELTREVVNARLVVLTLGLAEGWVDLETGLAINAINGRVLARDRDRYALHEVSFDETVRSLREIVELIDRHHATGEYRLILTVSPVPLGATFSADDIVVASGRAKAILLAAAQAFCREHSRADYFPSYEMVVNSDRALAWRPDRLHVNTGMVAHIMDRFIEAAFEDRALPRVTRPAPGSEAAKRLAPSRRPRTGGPSSAPKLLTP